ncbi:Mur ligase [Blakeslea trispora]|nr:Mur ligase [Blakeslea trispora]
MNFGLERIHQLLDALERPDTKVKIVHVAGTNGKGSVCAYIASVLSSCGYRVGRFNSPHLIEPRDSMVINDQPVSESDYQRAMRHVGQINTSIGASSFELLVAAALYLFQEHQVDFVVLEVGLGGLLDATNAIREPVMTLITSIGLDHASILGHTIEAIATAKAGIMKQGTPVVIAPNTKQVEHTLIAYATEHNVEYRLAPKAHFTEPGWAQLGAWRYPIPLLGDYQLENSAAAVTALAWMHERGLIDLTPARLVNGMQKTRWPGRLDWVRSDQYPSLLDRYGLTRVLVDGAHNPPAIHALRQFIDQELKDQPILWIVGITEGKEVHEMLQVLIQPQDRLVAVPFQTPEGMPWIQAMSPQQIVSHVAVGTCSTAGSLEEGLHQIQSWMQPNRAVVLCGSLYLVADLYRLLK